MSCRSPRSLQSFRCRRFEVGNDHMAAAGAWPTRCWLVARVCYPFVPVLNLTRLVRVVCGHCLRWSRSLLIQFICGPFCAPKWTIIDVNWGWTVGDMGLWVQFVGWCAVQILLRECLGNVVRMYMRKWGICFDTIVYSTPSANWWLITRIRKWRYFVTFLRQRWTVICFAFSFRLQCVCRVWRTLGTFCMMTGGMIGFTWRETVFPVSPYPLPNSWCMAILTSKMKSLCFYDCAAHHD